MTKATRAPESSDDYVAVPPQDIPAEENLLGACMISSHAIDACLEVDLRPEEFYRASHGLMWQAIRQMTLDGVTVDAITLCDRLDRDGHLKDVGGRDRVKEIATLVPSATNVGRWAGIVQENSLLRGLIRVGGAITTLGWERGDDVRGLLDSAEGLMFDLAQERRTSDFIPIATAVDDTVTRIEELFAHGRQVTGIATGYHNLDAMTAGLQPGNLVILAARPSMGKRLGFDANVLTPAGWRRNGDLAVGDHVIGGDGKSDVVLAVYDSYDPSPFYSVTFSDGAVVECCEDHLWLTRTRLERRQGRPGAPRTTKEIAATLKRRGDTGSNHSVPWVAPVEFEEQETPPLDPYWLGLYLGDGSTTTTQVRLTNPEPDVQKAFVTRLAQCDTATVVPGTGGRCETVAVRRSVRTKSASAAMCALRDLGLDGLRSHEKFIPRRYLLASADDRLALLQGLCDTDGYVTDPHGACVELCTASERLRDGILFLVRSLGGRATSSERPTHYTRGGERNEAKLSHRIVLSFPTGGIVPVRSVKHLSKWRGGLHSRRERYIVSVDPIGRRPGRCITVSRGLYVTDGFVVTHNTALALNIVAHVAKQKKPVAVFTLEMSKLEVTQRLLAAEALIDAQQLTNGKLDRDGWAKLVDAASKLRETYIEIDESPALTASEMRSKARRLRLRHPDLALVVVDYIQLMTSGVTDNRVQDVSQTSRTLKVLARELGVPVLALSQLSRAVEQRHDKRPILSDLRESGGLEQDADVVLFIYRDEYYNPEDTDQQGIAEVNIAKHRNGPTGLCKLAFVKRFVRFSMLPPS